MIFETKKFNPFLYIVEFDYKKIDQHFRPTGWIHPLRDYLTNNGVNNSSWKTERLNNRRGVVPGCELGVFCLDIDTARIVNNIIGMDISPPDYGYEEYFKSQKKPWKIVT